MNLNENSYKERVGRKVLIDHRKPKRGEIWIVARAKDYMDGNGSPRPAIIVSNNCMNTPSDRVMMVFTTRQNHERDTHVPVKVNGVTSYAICENINTIYKERLRDCIGSVTEEEMQAIETAMRKGLDLKEEKENWKDKPLCIGCEEKDRYAAMKARAEKAEIERDTYKKMVDVLMDKMMDKG